MSWLSPKQRFRLNRLRNRYDTWRGEARTTRQAVTAEQKMCISCRALIGRGERTCPYCGQRQRVFAASPTGKVISRVMPGGGSVTGFLLGAIILMFIAEIVLSGASGSLMAEVNGDIALRLGENLPWAYGQHWRLITAQFLHADLIHIGMNALALWILGPIVESLYGSAKTLVLYLATGIGGYVVSGVIESNASLGASGALFGLIGIMLAYGLRNRHTGGGQQVRQMAVQYVIYGVMMVFVFPHVDNFAHFGGFASGFLLGLVVPDGEPTSEGQVAFWNSLRWIALAVVALSFGLMIRYYFHSARG